MKTNRKSPIQAWTAKVGLMVLTLIIALMAGEVAVRKLMPQPMYAFAEGMFESSDVYGYRLSPQGTYRHQQPEYDYTLSVNRWGFRGDEPETNAAHRVLVLGDSYGMGQGVEDDEVLCDLVERELKAAGVGVDVFNASVSGYSTVNHLAALRHLTAHYDPNLVIVLFYWNDMGKTRSYEVVDGTLVKSDNVKHAGLRLWLNRHSQLYTGVKRIYYDHLKTKPLARDSIRTHDMEALRVTREQLREMNRLCVDRDAPMEIVLLPLYGIQEGDEAFKAMKSQFTDMLVLDDMHVWDWTEVLPEVAREELAYPIDLHWTPKGHAYFAMYLGDIIRDAIAPRTAQAF